MKNTANKGAEWYAERIACLAEFTTSERYEVLRRTVAMRTRYMTVLAENMYHGQNAAALIRHCEAFGVQEMHTVETLCRFEPNPDIVRGTDQWVDVRRHPSTGEALAALRSAGYRIVATTPHREDVTPETFDVAAGPFALVFGTEHAGISDEVIAGADEFLRIPMCGMVESLNVSASAAILIYMLSERMRLTVGEWRMTDAQFREMLEFIRRTRKEGRIGTSYACEGFLGDYETEVRDYFYQCAAGVSVASIRVDGAISGCTSIRANFHQGNIYRDKFWDVWQNRFEPFRNRDWARRGACADCKMFRYCLGGGMHLHGDDGELLYCHYHRL